MSPWTPPSSVRLGAFGLDSKHRRAHLGSMASVSKRSTTTQCIGCGAAMVLERIQPDPSEPDCERHEFRCEICSATAFFKFPPPKKKRPEQGR
jgi:hypothetical protein